MGLMEEFGRLANPIYNMKGVRSLKETFSGWMDKALGFDLASKPAGTAFNSWWDKTFGSSPAPALPAAA